MNSLTYFTLGHDRDRPIEPVVNLMTRLLKHAPNLGSSVIVRSIVSPGAGWYTTTLGVQSDPGEFVQTLEMMTTDNPRSSFVEGFTVNQAMAVQMSPSAFVWQEERV